MKAAVFDRYGPPDVLRVEEVLKPVPRTGEVLIRVRATTVNSGDVRVRGLDVPRGLGPLMRLRLGLFGPRQPILGMELAGEVEAVGEGVTRFAPGDRVLGSGGFGFGCHAQYRCLPEDGALAKIPDGVTDEEAVATCFGGETALVFFGRAELKRGEKVLINGASGAVGTAAVQIAKHLGAEVTAVCSGQSAALVTSLGADHLIDYTSEDFTRNGETYDVIMDAVGNAPYGRVKGSLAEGGRFLPINPQVGDMIRAAYTKAIISGGPEEEAFNAEMYRRIIDLVVEGALRAVVDRTYPLEEIVEAHRYVETGHKHGSVVLTIDRD